MKLSTAVSEPQAVESSPSTSVKRANPISFFEFWPGWLFYTPVVAHWLMLGLRHGDFSLPTAANPHISTGGLCGESKLSILDQVGPTARDLVAPARGVIAQPGNAAAVEAAMQDAGLAYPVVVKPDIGCNGTGVRLIRDTAGIAAYLREFPPGGNAGRAALRAGTERGRDLLRAPPASARRADHLGDDQAAADGGRRRGAPPCGR